MWHWVCVLHLKRCTNSEGGQHSSFLPHSNAKHAKQTLNLMYFKASFILSGSIAMGEQTNTIPKATMSWYKPDATKLS